MATVPVRLEPDGTDWCPLPPGYPPMPLPDWQKAHEVIYPPADTERIGVWTWARQHNIKHMR
ncbi:MAG TPA: hypothetical protein VM285_00520 [Polyangia bacterium]|nr:hypothetical protein [Polyangia bacterium]